MAFVTQLSKIVHFAVWFAPVFGKKVVQKSLPKCCCSARSALLPERGAKLSKCTHSPSAPKNVVFDHQSCTKTKIAFAFKTDWFSQSIRFKAFREKLWTKMKKWEKIMHAVWAKRTTTILTVSACIVLLVQGEEFCRSISRNARILLRKWWFFGRRRPTLLDLLNNNIY